MLLAMTPCNHSAHRFPVWKVQVRDIPDAEEITGPLIKEWLRKHMAPETFAGLDISDINVTQKVEGTCQVFITCKDPEDAVSIFHEIWAWSFMRDVGRVVVDPVTGEESTHCTMNRDWMVKVNFLGVRTDLGGGRTQSARPHRRGV